MQPEMKPIQIQIPKELFEPAATKHYAGKVKPFQMAIGMDEYSFAQPLSWDADITNTGDALLVAGSVSGAARGVCVRCLEAAEFDVTGEIEGYFVIEGADAPDDLDADEFDTLPADNMIDMAPLINQALIIEMPLVPLCSDDCRGLCAQCGANLNEGACECAAGADADADAASEADANDAASNPFAVLKNYKFD